MEFKKEWIKEEWMELELKDFFFNGIKELDLDLGIYQGHLYLRKSFV